MCNLITSLLLYRYRFFINYSDLSLLSVIIIIIIKTLELFIIIKYKLYNIELSFNTYINNYYYNLLII